MLQRGLGIVRLLEIFHTLLEYVLGVFHMLIAAYSTDALAVISINIAIILRIITHQS